MNQYEKKLEDLEENVRLEQSEVSLAGEVCRKASYLVSPNVRLFLLDFLHLQFAMCNKQSDSTDCEWMSTSMCPFLEIQWNVNFVLQSYNICEKRKVVLKNALALLYEVQLLIR